MSRNYLDVTDICQESLDQPDYPHSSSTMVIRMDRLNQQLQKCGLCIVTQEEKARLSELHIIADWQKVTPEDRAVLDACVTSMSGLTDEDLESSVDDEVMGPLSAAMLAKRRATKTG